MLSQLEKWDILEGQKSGGFVDERTSKDLNVSEGATLPYMKALDRTFSVVMGCATMPSLAWTVLFLET